MASAQDRTSDLQNENAPAQASLEINDSGSSASSATPEILSRDNPPINQDSVTGDIETLESEVTLQEGQEPTQQTAQETPITTNEHQVALPESQTTPAQIATPVKTEESLTDAPKQEEQATKEKDTSSLDIGTLKKQYLDRIKLIEKYIVDLELKNLSGNMTDLEFSIRHKKLSEIKKKLEEKIIDLVSIEVNNLT
ncbi:MAG: hypothetical protein ACTSYF_11250 [Promethearchaeota archaeon]